VLFGAVQVFADMNGFEVVHVLIYELCDRDLSQITVGLVANESHREDVAQRRRDEMRILPDQQLEASGEFFVGRHGLLFWFMWVAQGECIREAQLVFGCLDSTNASP
jgi:hypothetical protein